MSAGVDALAFDLGGDGCARGRARSPARSRERVVAQRRLDRLLAAGPDLRQSHAVGGQQAGQRMDQHGLHAERVGDQAGVLAAGRAEAVERVLGDVVAALHRDLLDGVGHVLDGDADEAVGHFLGRAAVADLGGQLGESGAHGRLVERLVAGWSEDGGEVAAATACRP